MNKTLKVVSVILVLLVILGLVFFMLPNSSDTLVATTSNDKYDEKLEISFKNNKVDTVIATFTCKDSEYDVTALIFDLNWALNASLDADEMESALSKQILESDDNTVKVKLTALEFSKLSDINEEMSKKEVKAALELDNYNVK